MPTYEYECAACHHRYETLQSITAPPLQKCPRCGKKRARRLIGAGAGLIFKGSGFYITDYRKPSGKPSEKKPPSRSDKASPPPPASPGGSKSTPGKDTIAR